MTRLSKLQRKNQKGTAPKIRTPTNVNHQDQALPIRHGVQMLVLAGLVILVVLGPSATGMTTLQSGDITDVLFQSQSTQSQSKAQIQSKQQSHSQSHNFLRINAKQNIRRMATMTTDEILSDPEFYETQEIHGSDDNVLLGHYWFPTQTLLQQTTGRMGARKTDNHHPQREPHDQRLLPLNALQTKLLEDHDIIPEMERARCER